MLLAACGSGGQAGYAGVRVGDVVHVGPYIQVFAGPLPAAPAQTGAVEGFREGQGLWNKSRNARPAVSPPRGRARPGQRGPDAVERGVDPWHPAREPGREPKPARGVTGRAAQIGDDRQKAGGLGFSCGSTGAEVVVTTASGGPTAGGEIGRGHLEVSEAAREQVIDLLRTAFIQGRLTWDDLGSRTDQVLASRTHAELAAITASVPAGRTAAPPPDAIPSPARKRVHKKVVTWGACAVLAPAALGVTFLTFYGGFIVAFLLVILAMAVTAEPVSR